MRVTVLHPGFEVVGGAERVALHVIQRVLQRGGNIDLLTVVPPDLKAVHAATGLDFREVVQRGSLRVQVVSPPPIGVKRRLVQVAWLHRYARKWVKQSDFWISTYNEANLGVRGIQYVHHPLFANRELLRRYCIDDSPASLMRSAYDHACRVVARISPEALRCNETLTNSVFMSNVLREAFGIDSTVLYPAFLTEADLIDPGEVPREDRMVSVGRIAPDKHTLWLIELMSAVHQKVPKMTFAIAGFVDDKIYADAVRRRASEMRLPLQFVTNADREEIRRLLRTSRYFLSAKPYEHFGISTVEAIAAGAIPFVHDSGGSVEIVENNYLRYSSIDGLADAVSRLYSMNNEYQVVNQNRQSIRRFSISAFYDGIDSVINRLLHN